MLVFHVVVINNSCAFCYTAEKEEESFIPEIHNAALFFVFCSKSVISQAQELILVDVTVKKKKKKKKCNLWVCYLCSTVKDPLI